ncbi:abscisic acid receptor PYL4-like [Forsythia ovata]|uniref:Abscisic acid receptor PYL4-like n=1 Tax=Forsythia ovata TaxID=205694 RepID=A0ABD1P6T9_9LAMI
MHLNHPNSSVLLQRINTTTPSFASAAAAATCNKQVQKNPTTAVQWRMPLPCSTQVLDHVACFHTYVVGQNQCCSAVIQQINALVDTVWSVVCRFDNLQAYKHFVMSTERLEIFDDEHLFISFSVVGGNHCLANYRFVTTLHPAANGGDDTIIVESYVVFPYPCFVIWGW